MNLTTYSVLGTIAASSADAVLADHKLTFTGAPVFDVRSLEMILKAPVAETAYASTVTPTDAASKTFNLAISQWRPDLGITVSDNVTYTSPAVAPGATAICNGLRASLAANPKFAKITTGGTATMTLASAAGYPQVLVTSIGDGVLTLSGVTAGINERNTYQSILNGFNQIVPSSLSGLAAGKTYLSVQLNGTKPGTSDNVAGNASSTTKQHTIYVDVSATNYAALLTRLTEFSNGVIAGASAGGVANPEEIALGSGSTA